MSNRYTRYPIPKISLRSEGGFDSNLPPVLIAIIVLSIISVTSAVIAGMLLQLSYFYETPLFLISVALIKGAMAILVLYAIISDRGWSKWLIAIWLVTYCVITLKVFHVFNITFKRDILILIPFIILCSLMFLWLVFGVRSRVHYLQLNGKEVPQKLLESIKPQGESKPLIPSHWITIGIELVLIALAVWIGMYGLVYSH